MTGEPSASPHSGTGHQPVGADPSPSALTTPEIRGPQADRDLLAWHALRQRQLLTALVHGGRRNWRDDRRIWPAVVLALVLIGLAVAAISVVAAFRP